jgi:hypothetical protein
MSKTIRLLVVEDEESALSDWRNKIEFYNVDKENRHFEIVPVYADSVPSAEAALSSRNFDAVVVDLRLKTGEIGSDHNDHGNEIVELLARTSIATVAIYTGQPGEAKLPPSSPNITVIPKGEGLDPVLKWLDTQSLLISHIQCANSAIQKDMASLFHGSIWPRWKFWVDAGKDDKLLRVALTRHLVSHLYATLLDGNDVHSEEYYFVPPINSTTLSTGDLLQRPDGTVEIVVTPLCDITHSDKSETIQLAECENVAVQWTKMRSQLTDPDTTTAEKARNKIHSWRQHRSKNVLHFLPEMRTGEGTSEGPWFVRFDHIRSVKKSSKECSDLLPMRFASIASVFLPSLVERTGGFFSRIGTPDLS